jgi:hypothetical protein
MPKKYIADPLKNGGDLAIYLNGKYYDLVLPKNGQIEMNRKDTQHF